MVLAQGRPRHIDLQINRHLRRGQRDQALALSRKLTTEHPDDAANWYLHSRALTRTRASREALTAVERAIDLAPLRSLYKTQLAQCQLKQGLFSEAQATAVAVMWAPGLSAGELDGLGNVLSACGELESAAHCFQRATQLSPDTPHYLFNLATAWRALGDLEAAEAAFTRVIELNPRDWDAYAARSGLRQLSRERNHIRELESRLADIPKDNQGEVKLCYALAKELEDTGDYRRSFNYLQRGACKRRETSNYRVGQDIETMSGIKQSYTAERLQQAGSGTGNNEPIFILGLPRTGTTLAERILGSHSEVYAAGELHNFAAQLLKLTQQQSEPAANKQQLVKQTLRLDFTRLGDNYIASTRPRTGHSRFFIDKMPLNFLYIGLIHLALPSAKIIHLTRSPMDACYAIYKTLFNQAYPFSYDLKDLASYYRAYRDLMSHWHTCLPGKVFDLSYEALVSDQETTSRALLEHCGLEWQGRCLNFTTNKQPTATASASQVRQGIYNSSVQRWRCYKEQLSPLYKLLEGAGINPENYNAEI